MLEKYILENENLIEEFDSNYYSVQKEYPVLAALKALETTNDIQKCYYLLEDKNTDYNALKLYAFLQSLFVSIDSLYALSYSLTKSKNTININKNQVLRELKYIRNDVVGHPANRMFNSFTLAYCILDTKSICKDSFDYNIYSNSGIINKKVDILNLVNNYYIECNNLLKELLIIARSTKKKSNYTKLALEALNLFDMNGDYYQSLLNLKKIYLKEFNNASSKQHRLLWRLEIIDELRNYNDNDIDILELKEYAIGLEILKIYQLLSDNKNQLELGRRKPLLLSSFYRFLKKNKTSIKYINNITDLKSPYIEVILNELLDLAINKNIESVIKYLNLLIKFYNEKNDNLLYAFALPLKDFKG